MEYGLDPYKYLSHVLHMVAQVDLSKPEALAALLPENGSVGMQKFCSKIKKKEKYHVGSEKYVSRKIGKDPSPDPIQQKLYGHPDCCSRKRRQCHIPKNPQKDDLNAVKILKKNRIPFPVIFSGELCGDAAKWRGERRINLTDAPLQTTRGIKKK